MSKFEGARFIRRTINIILSNPVIKSIVKIAPLIWFTMLLGVFSDSLGTKTSTGAIKKGWLIATAILYIAITIYLFLEQFYSSYIEKHEKNYSALAFEVMESIKSLYNDKLKILTKSFVKYKKNGGELQNLYNEYDHEERINDLLEELKNCIQKLTKIKKTNISTGLLYKFEGDEWKVPEDKYCEDFKSAEDLANGEKSLAKSLLNNESYDFILLNNKYKEGVKFSIYKVSEKDEKASNKHKNRYGSIAGLRFYIKKDEDTYLQAAIFIATFGKRIDYSFLQLYREDAEFNLENYILPYFEMNFKTELIYLNSEN